MVCAGSSFSALQSLLGTAVGVGFIFPVVVQILNAKSDAIIESSELLLTDLSRQSDRASFRDLGDLLNSFQQTTAKLENLSSTFIGLSSLAALLSYCCLIWSTFQPMICMSLVVAATLVSLVSLPVVFSAVYFFLWFDATRPIIARQKLYYNM